MPVFLSLVIVIIQIFLFRIPFFFIKKFPNFPLPWLKKPFFILSLAALQVIYFQLLSLMGYFTYLNEILVANYL